MTVRNADSNKRKGNDMTLALSGPDNVKFDKRYHVQTEATMQMMMKNSRKQQGLSNESPTQTPHS
ncbi:hypothetical protein [Alicyclobacillus acidoterrestris]|uniref:Uncharacterized protein n=1 Tax=Alicyclobacillus acidoterrestris (strain ATCC 49025 / DSM 3922 / CIP 106132 / NCIMB 13137 / GD3B) TaxID=1356854 RepID=T0CV14_ALIAG|nr:hypothetical protein [Alicyclobacillus acidoterrestris]EPZ43227.1 hypothetical protein N007_13745 [Alicyclobacillus acidoterrestris ATCC 49025]UNO48539.1 hypothetical protein K1I37_18040 [Alicyclobacillus acidoterrestris]